MLCNTYGYTCVYMWHNSDLFLPSIFNYYGILRYIIIEVILQVKYNITILTLYFIIFYDNIYVQKRETYIKLTLQNTIYYINYENNNILL